MLFARFLIKRESICGLAFVLFRFVVYLLLLVAMGFVAVEVRDEETYYKVCEDLRMTKLRLINWLFRCGATSPSMLSGPGRMRSSTGSTMNCRSLHPSWTLLRASKSVTTGGLFYIREQLAIVERVCFFC